MKDIIKDTGLIAYCGLYCGACKKYLSGKCTGCRENVKATWCKVRTCCIDNKYNSCVDCSQFNKTNDCKKFNNIFAKLFALIFKSDRQACLNLIKEKGYENYAQEMTDKKEMTIKK